MSRSPHRRRLAPSGILGVGLATLSSVIVTSRAELLPDPTVGWTRPLRMTFEILPGEDATELPRDVAEIEGIRLEVRERMLHGRRYVRATLILPRPGDIRRERVLFFVREERGLRMLGFQRVRRERESSMGETVVFDSGAANPLEGTSATVPASTYTLLGLAVALRGIEPDGTPASIHLWSDSEPSRFVVAESDGRERLSLLGREMTARKILVRDEDGSRSATYWIDDAPPHVLLRYEGPAHVLDSDDSPIVLRATSSSEQSRALLDSGSGATRHPPPD